MNSERGPAPARGFTLLEVMVALAIITLGLMAVFNGIIQISDQSTHLRERAFAHWVAMNEITRLRVAGALPDVSEFDGDVEFANASYRWAATVSETGVEDLRRIDLNVSYVDTPDDVIATTVGFVAPRAPPVPGGGSWSGGGDAGGRGDRDDGRDDEGDNDPDPDQDDDGDPLTEDDE